MIWPAQLQYLKKDVLSIQIAQVFLCVLFTVLLPLGSQALLIGCLISCISTFLVRRGSFSRTGALYVKSVLWRMFFSQALKWGVVSVLFVVTFSAGFSAFGIILGYALGQLCYFAAFGYRLHA